MRLRTKLALMLVIVAVLPLGVMTFELVRRSVRSLEQSAREYHLATADVVLTEVRDRIERARTELAAGGAAMAQTEIPTADRMRAARAHMLGARTIDAFSLFTPEGAYIDTMTALASGDPAAGAPKKGLGEALRTEALAEGVAFGELVEGKEGAPLLPIAVPVYRGEERQVYAFVATHLDLGPLSDTVATMSKRRFGDAEDRVRLLDAHLRVVAAHDAGLRWSEERSGLVSGMSGSETQLAVDVAHTSEYERGGVPLIGALVPLPELRWAVVVEQPQDEAYQAVQTTWRTALVVGGIFVAVAILLGLLLARRFAAPITQVAQAAKKVADGDFEVAVAVGSRDEVGDMARSFNKMTLDLQRYRDRVIDETRKRENLSRYLSPDVVESILTQETELTLGGVRKDVTVMFADVVAFTSLADKHEPEFIVGILNELFTFATEIVFKHGGIVDKFIGDCVMAVFGAPVSRGDEAIRAVRAAEEILRWLEIGNSKWKKELGRDLAMGIGIASGSVVVGNIGSERRMEYTVIGDIVNLAARLESLARPGQILIAHETMELIIDEFDAESVGEHQLTGDEPREIFVVMD